MRPTKPINHTGNPHWKYVPRSQSSVEITIKRWLRDYEKAWDDAHAENLQRESAVERANEIERAAKVRMILK